MHLREEKKKKLAPAIKDMLSDLVLSLLRIKQRIILLLCAVFVCVLICLFIYLKELAQEIVEADKSSSLLLASWRPRSAGGVAQVQV